MIEDLVKLKSKNVLNNLHSVTNYKITLGWVHPKGFTPIYSVMCFEHGACNCVGITKHGKIWRCLTCNEGCFEPNEVELCK